MAVSQSKWHLSTTDVQVLIYERDKYSTRKTSTLINIS